MKERTHQQRILPSQYSAPFKKIGCGHRCKEIIEIVKNRTHTLSPFLALMQNLNVLCCLPSDNIMYNVFSLVHSYNISTSGQPTTHNKHIHPTHTTIPTYVYVHITHVYTQVTAHTNVLHVHITYTNTHTCICYICVRIPSLRCLCPNNKTFCCVIVCKKATIK